MNRTARNQQRGFTLAEILVTTAIFAVIMIAALSIYDQSNRVFKTGTESADMQQSTRIGFDKLVADLRMAGFDYNRGGTPTAAGQYMQPDEQIEYAGPTAVVFRANFNYNTAPGTGNGLEPAYTPLDPTTNAPIFPFVTTSNDEIVAYVTRSVDNTKNTGSISFYADSARPRAAYPGGAAESLLKISNTLCATCGIDTTNANPPYTLYRMTVSDILNKQPGTPVAENIRSLNFFYYTDTNGATLLKETNGTDIAAARNADGTTIPATASITILNPDGTKSISTPYTGAIGGAGQYDPASPGTAANFADRRSRATIQSIRVNVIGMNANPEPGYTQPTESIAAIRNYRQYPLAALVVPRNLGLTGYPEPSNSAPSAPTITGICTSHCAAPVICWTAPSGGGPVSQYRIEWDTNANGAYPNFLIVTDPAATTAILPDNGVMNPSLVWYYRMFAQNDNGSSPPQNPIQAQPKNATKPLPPAAASITASSPANYAIALGWVAPTNNDPAKATMTCTGSGCTTDPTTIPSQEIIKYRVFRGLTPTFDPFAAGQGVEVLAASGAQPPSGGPGAPVAWNDSPAASAFPPGTCVQYYYRLQALDRCFVSNSYNASNNLNDSISTLSPPVGTNAIPGRTTDVSTAKATAPIGLVADTTTSVCPAPASLNCKIDLTWSQVTTDNLGNGIGVDRYRVARYRKKLADPGFVPDMTFNGTGYFDIPTNYSQLNTGTVSFSDTTGPAVDPADSLPWYYEYKVAANDCNLGLYSLPADFPTTCSVKPAIVQAGASNPLASGDTPAQAWVFNAGDTITTSAPAGITISKVTYDVSAWPSGTFVQSVPVGGAPFKYVWTDRVDLQIYQVKITILTSTGCTEVHVKYVQDQAAAACAFANQTATPFNPAVGAVTTEVSETYTLTNAGADPLQLAGRPVNVNWVIPDSNHSDMVLIALAYQAGAFTTSDNFSALPGSVARTIPSGLPNIPAGGSLTLTIRWAYNTSDDPPKLAGQPLLKLCLDYVVASEPAVTKHCNLVGQIAATANPTACD